MTLLLGALCVWALSLLVLAVFGLGGRHALHGTGVGQAPPLSSVTLRALAPRLGAPETYAEVGQRPLLNFDRRPAQVVVGDAAEGAAELDVVLTSVMITPSLKMAIVRRNEGGAVLRVRLGDRVEGTSWALVSLEPRRAIFDGQGGQRALDLRAFDGRGGETPTAVATVLPASPVQTVEQPGPVAVAQLPPSVSTPTPASVRVGTPAVAANPGAPMTQEQQVEAIRRRIEARRAQMRQENARAAAQPTK